MAIGLTQLGKYLSFLLRHDPAAAGITLDPHGWAKIDELVAGGRVAERPFTREDVLAAVAADSKQRFALSADGERIRAVQGHSIQVDLSLQPVPPPEFLWHGTATRFKQSILQQGLLKQSRHHVHLSADQQTAERVGARHGKPVILRVAAARMFRDGFRFFQSENGVWLTDAVPVEYLEEVAT